MAAPLASALVASFALAACGGGGGDGSRPSAGPLATVANTSTNRQLIVEDDPAALVKEAGVGKGRASSSPLSPDVVAATDEIPASSPLGSGLLTVMGSAGLRPLGYNPLEIGEELSVGAAPPHQLSVVSFSGTPSSRVTAALRRARLKRTRSVDGYATFTVNPRHVTEAFVGTLIGVRTVELSKVEIASGGLRVSPSALARALSGQQASHPLTSDPAVGAMLSLFGDAPVKVMGTSLIASPVKALGGKSLSAFEKRALIKRLGLAKLKVAPVFAGYAYLPGPPAHAKVVAATIYATPQQAKVGASVLGKALRTGYSYINNVPYTRLWHVDSVVQHSKMVVARLSLRHSAVLTQAMQQFDFPLFWGPVNDKG